MGTTGETTAMGTKGADFAGRFSLLVRSPQKSRGNPDTHQGLIYYCTEESVASTLDTARELTMTLDFLTQM
jgi:hypothetical protein